MTIDFVDEAAVFVFVELVLVEALLVVVLVELVSDPEAFVVVVTVACSGLTNWKRWAKPLLVVILEAELVCFDAAVVFVLILVERVDTALAAASKPQKSAPVPH